MREMRTEVTNIMSLTLLTRVTMLSLINQIMAEIIMYKAVSLSRGAPHTSQYRAESKNLKSKLLDSSLDPYKV